MGSSDVPQDRTPPGPPPSPDVQTVQPILSDSATDVSSILIPTSSNDSDSTAETDDSTTPVSESGCQETTVTKVRGSDTSQE
jgi:hypothetical protein